MMKTTATVVTMPLTATEDRSTTAASRITPTGVYYVSTTAESRLASAEPQSNAAAHPATACPCHEQHLRDRCLLRGSRLRCRL